MKHSSKIEKLLGDRGWSMLELSRRAKIGREQARRLSSRVPASTLAAIRMARTLGVSADWLFDDKQGWPGAESSSDRESANLLQQVDLPALRQELCKLLGITPPNEQ